MTTTATRPTLAPTRPALPVARRLPARRPRRFLGHTSADWAKILFYSFVVGAAGGILLGVTLVTVFKAPPASVPTPRSAAVAPAAAAPAPAPVVPTTERAPTARAAPHSSAPRTTTQWPETRGPVAPPAAETRTVTATVPPTAVTTPPTGGGDPPSGQSTVDEPPVDGPNPGTGAPEPPAREPEEQQP